MSTFYFNGRPSGLGNRLHEVFNLMENCQQHEDLSYEYHWPPGNKSNRSYPVLFTTPERRLVIRTGKPFPNNKYRINGGYSADGCKVTRTKETRWEVAKLIKPKFEISFESDNSDILIKPVGVHIRSTDRIGGHRHPDQMTRKTYERCFHHTLELINKLKPKYLFVAADNIKEKNQFISKLDKNITVVHPITNCKNGPYVDFFALSMCSKIYMCSKFSSFAACASAVGNIPLISYWDEDATTLFQYRTIVEYEMIDKEKRPRGFF